MDSGLKLKFTYCLCLALEQGNITKETVTLIRLGEALKYDEKHDKALELDFTLIYK